MARFTNVTGLNGETLTPKEYTVASGTAASIEPGMVVIVSSNNAAEGTNGLANTGDILGIAASTSTETASAAGVVLVYRAPVLRAKAVATTPGNLSSSVILTKCTLDVSGTDHTVDENDTTNGFIRILDYDDTTNGNLDVEVITTL